MFVETCTKSNNLLRNVVEILYNAYFIIFTYMYVCIMNYVTCTYMRINNIQVQHFFVNAQTTKD